MGYLIVIIYTFSISGEALMSIKALSVLTGFLFISILLLGFQQGDYARVEQPGALLNLVEAFPELDFSQSLYLTHAGDGSDRIFVVEKTGAVHVFPNDPAITETRVFLDISDRILPPGDSNVGETGLLSIAFHPQYSNNGLLYLSYVDENLVSIISEVSISSDPDSADLATERILLEMQQPQRNHNGGHIAFGPDGYLYIAFGDGFSESSRDGIDSGDPLGHGQNLETWFSAVLRVDVDSVGTETAYAIPDDNPFVGNEEGWKEEIYAYGFRNPWRFSFDREEGTLWLADVGDKKAEEIDLIEPGLNYGWNLKEGIHCFEDVPCDTTQWSALEDPIFQYLRDQGESITGGYVYRGPGRDDLVGRYIYGDFDFRNVWALTYEEGSEPQNELLVQAPGAISSFGEDEAGEVYIVGFSGTIWRFEPQSRTSIAEPGLEHPFSLSPGFPNPAQHRVQFDMALDSPAQVQVEVFNLLGQRVNVLMSGQKSAGMHSIVWEGGDDAGNRMPAGLYFVTLTADNHRQTQAIQWIP